MCSEQLLHTLLLPGVYLLSGAVEQSLVISCVPSLSCPRSETSIAGHTGSGRNSGLLFQSNRTRRVEVVVQLLSDIVDHFLRFHAVSSLIKGRSKDRDGAFARSDGYNSASHSALCGQAHMPRPTSGAIVETRHCHGAENVRDVFALDDLLTGGGIHAVVRQRCSHTGELCGIYPDGALLGIDIDGLKWVGINAIIFS